MIEQCHRSVWISLFNNSAEHGFWKLFEEIYTFLMKYPNRNIAFIFQQIADVVIDECPNFDVLSLKYFIAKIKEGLLP